MPKIKDLAVICRSKNANPFLLTLDVVFPDRETFDKVLASGVINRSLISRLYSVPESDVLLVEFPPANAFKATIPRLHGSGAVEDSDVYGAQQHGPLMVALKALAGKNLHYDGKLCDEGCLTFPYSPSDIPAGPVYEFNILHAVEPTLL